MDFSVTDFNVRLRSIKLGELLVAIIVASFISIILATLIHHIHNMMICFNNAYIINCIFHICT